ncbi:hypothetical protein D3C72_1170030 [compost metagenome]
MRIDLRLQETILCGQPLFKPLFVFAKLPLLVIQIEEIVNSKEQPYEPDGTAEGIPGDIGHGITLTGDKVCDEVYESSLYGIPKYEVKQESQPHDQCFTPYPPVRDDQQQEGVHLKQDDDYRQDH